MEHLSQDRSLKGTRPRHPTIDSKYLNDVVKESESSKVLSAIRQIRINESYQKLATFFSQSLIPTFFLGAVLLVALACISQFSYHIYVAGGHLCKETPPDQRGKNPNNILRENSHQTFLFAIADECMPTGVILSQGKTYKIRLMIPKETPWADGLQRAGVMGVMPERIIGRGDNFLNFIATPFRRHLSENWLKPFIRIGAKGNDNYPLDSNPSIADDPCIYDPRLADEERKRRGCEATATPPLIANSKDITINVQFVARTSGELFIYVNDLGPTWFGFIGKQIGYRNNSGCAIFNIKEVAPTPLFGGDDPPELVSLTDEARKEIVEKCKKPIP